MIRRLDSFSDEIKAFCGDVYGTRTLGYYKSYGTELQDVSHYAQYTEDRLTAVLCNAFGHGSLTADAAADREELRDFTAFLGLHTLLCGKETATALGFDGADSGSVMQSFGTETTRYGNIIQADDPRFSFRAVYNLLVRCGFDVGDFAAWHGDVALRVRRAAAQIVSIQCDGQTVSTASMLFASDDAAYLGAVATDPAFRGHGLAGELVRYLTTLRSVSRILCKPHRVSFYTSLGFQQIGEFSICHFLN